MDADERPSKLRKLESAAPETTLDAESEEYLQQPTTETTSNPENSKPQQQTANDADAFGGDSENESDHDDLAPSGKDKSAEAQQEHQHGLPTQPMSKNQMKKLRKREEWEAGRDYRKAKRKEKLQERRQRKRTAREDEAERRELDGPKKQHDAQPGAVRRRSRRPVVLPITILIDCGFDDLMMEKERISLGSQLTRAYSDNWRAPFQSHLVISSWGGVLKERFDTVLHKHYLNWKGVTFEEGDFVLASEKAKAVMKGSRGGKLAAIFHNASNADRIEPAGSTASTDLKPVEERADTINTDTTTSIETADPSDSSSPTKPSQNIDSAQPQPPTEQLLSPSSPTTSGEVIYLTSDSPHTLSTLHPYSTYIVGGLVDKNRHKGICYKIACERGIKTAKLPIDKYMEMQSRKVLATNHVVEIMIRYLECGDWGEAFLQVIPKRKGGKLKGRNGGDEEDEENDDDDDDNRDGDDHEALTGANDYDDHEVILGDGASQSVELNLVTPDGPT